MLGADESQPSAPTGPPARRPVRRVDDVRRGRRLVAELLEGDPGRLGAVGRDQYVHVERRASPGMTLAPTSPPPGSRANSVPGFFMPDVLSTVGLPPIEPLQQEPGAARAVPATASARRIARDRRPTSRSE